MSSNVSNFSDFWHNTDIPGHQLISPAVWLKKIIKQIFSTLPDTPSDKVEEVVRRIFLAGIVVIAALPIALFTLSIGIPGRTIAYKCFSPSEQTSDLVIISSPSEVVHNRNFTGINVDGKHCMIPSPYPKSDFSIVKVAANGNCAFEGFLTERKRLGLPVDIADIGDFRIKSAQWIMQNCTNKEAHPLLENLVLHSIQEYLEVKLNWLITEEEQLLNEIEPDQTSIDSDQSSDSSSQSSKENVLKNIEIEIKIEPQKESDPPSFAQGQSSESSDPSKQEHAQAIERLEMIANEKKELDTKIQLVKEANSLQEKIIAPIFSDYMLAIQSDIDTDRVYASQAHYYAFAHMFEQQTAIQIFLEREYDYNLLAQFPASEKPSTTIRFLHVQGNHLNILIKKENSTI